MEAVLANVIRRITANDFRGHDDPDSQSEASRPAATQRGAAVCFSLGLFLVLLAIYALSPVRTSYDSRWSIHTSMSFLRGHAGHLTEYVPLLEENKLYAIEYCNGQPRTIFPIGVSLLATPAVALAALVNPGFNEQLKRKVPHTFEKVIAAIYGALAGVLFFWLVFTRFRSASIALAATMIFCFSTSMWSTATRALWQHGPLVLMLVIAMLLLLRARQRPALAQYASIPLAFAFIIRPTAAIPIVVLSAHALIGYRVWIGRYLAWAMVIAVPWLAYNVLGCGEILPQYYLPSRLLGTPRFAEALLGNLVSPARGLFVYSPVLLFAFSGFVLALRHRDERALHVAFGLIVVLHWVFVSHFAHWWVGATFGPRVMTDVVPFLVYFIAFNFRLPVVGGSWKQAAVSGCIAFLAGASLLIHAQGALREATYAWNRLPSNIDENPVRLWDWHDIQFLRRKVTLPGR